MQVQNVISNIYVFCSATAFFLIFKEKEKEILKILYIQVNVEEA